MGDDELKHISLYVNKQEQVSMMSDGTEVRNMAISFNFNPDEYECVRTKDKSYLIRLKK